MNGHKVTLKWNDSCNFYQPPRAHHCSINNDCIEKFDHHCPWVGTTIGQARPSGGGAQRCAQRVPEYSVSHG